MLRRHIYYWIKPFVPRRIRLGIRRWFAERRLAKLSGVWPILPGSESTPPDWPGWPEKKQFSFVITHDVEGPAGLAKCRQLAECEMKLGFRSSFNFIPEGSYSVPAELRAWLLENGFEVGVHDLHHDGKLYSSKSAFQENARRINSYLKDWGAVGYRSGFMLRNLDWHHELEVEYDATTFDTDPFEPQPDGVGTIFPFLILPTKPKKTGVNGDEAKSSRATSRPAKKGYVELPYTLAQDSTLFLLFKEKTPARWLLKLDWVAQHGGMALVNVHPDYLRFDGEKPSPNTFPVAYYTELLEAVKNKYPGRYWQPLPRELASWFRSTCPAVPPSLSFTNPTASTVPSPGTMDYSGLRGKRAAVLLYSSYPGDPRPYRAARAMYEAGMEVDMYCLGDKAVQPPHEVLDGVDVTRIPLKHKRSGALMYFLQYGRFITSAFWFLTKRSFQKKYDVVHVHNMPDILVFSTLIPKLRGAKIILDLHDPMPELMMTIYGVKPGSMVVSLLKFLEKASMRFANSIVTVNEACRKIFSARSCPAEKVHVVMNAPDEKIFQPRELATLTPPARSSATPFVIMYHGSLVERHGLDLAVDALASIKPSIPNAELHIYGSRNSYLEEVLASPTATSLGAAVKYIGSKSQQEIAAAINGCDVGIIPNRRSIFTELNTPTRIFEYLSQSKPVIAPRAPGIQDYFGPDDLIYFELGDAVDLAAKLTYVYQEPAAVAAIIKRGQLIYRQHDWAHEKAQLMNLFTKTLGVAHLPADKSPATVRTRGDE